jgi:hypothetical protein
MLKKSLFVVAIALLSVGAYAREYVTPDGSNVDWEYDGANSERKAESYNWPASYNSQDICTIPVRMDVGFWIKVNGCKDLKLNLKQVEIHKYSGSVDVSINCNVNIKLSVSWSKASGVDLGGYGSSVSVSPSTLDAPGGTVTISLTLKDVNLQNLEGGKNCLTVGSVTLKVAPNVTPNLAGGCSP